MTHPLELIQLEPLRRLSASLDRLIRSRLWFQVLIGLGAGVLVGFLLGPDVGWIEPATASTLTAWLALPGTLFLALIQMIIVPLVFASIVRGLAESESTRQLRLLGLIGGLYFLATGAMVTIEVAAAEGLQADPQTRVFVIVRPLSGPPMPVAVRALSFADLPAVVQLSDADAMQPGRTLSRFDVVSVLARLSRSGSPTSQPGDVESEIVQVRPLDRPAVSLLLN